MFLRIVRNGASSIYECSEFQIKKPKGAENRVFVFIEGDKLKTREFDIDMSDTELYLMNDQGKTIDSYSWKRGEYGKKKS